KKNRDVAAMIGELSRMTESQEIQALYDPVQEKIIFNTVPAILIKNIEVKLIVSAFKKDLQKITEKMLNQADSPNTRYQLIHEVENFLTLKGFPSAKIAMNSQKIDDHNVQIELDIDESHPCLIEKVIFSS